MRVTFEAKLHSNWNQQAENKQEKCLGDPGWCLLLVFVCELLRHPNVERLAPRSRSIESRPIPHLVMASWTRSGSPSINPQGVG